MSLQSPKLFNLGILASKGFDDPDFINELTLEHLGSIGHIFTNGANKLVTDFAQQNGIPFTVFPLIGRSLPWSTSQILDHVEFVYIIASPESKSANQIQVDCVKRHIKHRVVPYDPFTHWQEKLGKVAEILSATTREEIEHNDTLKAIWRAV